MKAIQVVGAIVLILGIVAVALAGTWRTGGETRTRVGPMEVTTGRTDTVAFPRWAGIGAIAIGAVLVLYPLVRRRDRSPKVA